MKLPIIVSEHGDIMMFPSQEEACSYLEPVDVKNGEYIAYDADGFLLQIEVSESEKSFMGFCKIVDSKVIIGEKVGENKSSELFQKLLAFSRAAKIEGVDANFSLPELVTFLEEFLSKKG